DQAGRLPVAQPPERLAAGAHSPLAVRPRVHRAARDPDVLSRRSALRRRPDLPVDPRPEGARAARQLVRLGDDEAGMGARLSLRRRARQNAGGPRLSLTPTPSQTVGPFFSFGLCGRPCNEVASGGPVRIEGRVLDGAGQPVPDAMVELWQADASCAYRPAFGWGRCGTDPEGRVGFT